MKRLLAIWFSTVLLSIYPGSSQPKYVSEENCFEINMQSDKNTYKPKEKILLNISFRNACDIPYTLYKGIIPGYTSDFSIFDKNGNNIKFTGKRVSPAKVSFVDFITLNQGTYYGLLIDIADDNYNYKLNKGEYSISLTYDSSMPAVELLNDYKQRGGLEKLQEEWDYGLIIIGARKSNQIKIVIR